jgi:serine phosphatase RsbU (regulator of sigma subunit)
VFCIFPQATRGYVVLAESLETKLMPQAMKQVEDSSSTSPPISRTIAERVIKNGEAILSTDVGEDSRFRLSDSISQLNIRSVMCAPMVGSAMKSHGMIQIETDDTERHFTDDDLEVLVNVANLAGQFVDHAQLHETQLQFDRRQRDLEVARQVQLHFLPQGRPEIPGYEIFDYYSAAHGVGGDYFSYIMLPDGRLAIAMGDVAGKGVPAALLMARLCSDVRYCLATQPTAAGAVRMLDELMMKAVVGGGFITFVLCVLNPSTHEVVVVNAGHLPPMWRHAATGKVEHVGPDAAHPPLGVGTVGAYKETSIQLAPHDALFLYTDGVSEATNKNGNFFGVKRLEKLLTQRLEAEKTIHLVLSDVHAFVHGKSQSDDICMLCLSRRA